MTPLHKDWPDLGPGASAGADLAHDAEMLALEQDFANDAEHWISTESGSHLLIEGDGQGGYTIKGGAGGKLDGQKVAPKSMSANRINEKTSAFNDPNFKPHEPAPEQKQGESFKAPEGHEVLKKPLKVERQTEKAYGVTNPAYAEAMELHNWGGASEVMRRGSPAAREAYREKRSLSWLPKSHSMEHEGHVVSMSGWLARQHGAATHGAPLTTASPESSAAPGEMQGTPKQVEWAKKIRDKHMSGIEPDLQKMHQKLEGKPQEQAKVQALRDALGRQSASFWIDRRDRAPRDLMQEVGRQISTAKDEMPDSLAFDRASVRRIDVDGRMHVEITPISKAAVNPYYGKEIPDFEELGLEPDRVYQLLRDPQELEKAAGTFNNIPLLDKHVVANADDPQKESVVGATGTDAAFDAPYLKNSLVVWDAEAIEGIDSRDQCELSCAYRYTPDMTPGTYEGQPYDGVMRSIIGNHIALVAAGRAGPDVVVADADPFKSQENGHADTRPNVGNLQLKKELNMTKKALSGKAVLAKGALLAALPTMAADSGINLNTLLEGVTNANWKARKPGIVAAIKPKLAADADVEDLVELLDKLDGEEPPEPPVSDEDGEGGDPGAAAEDADPIEEILALLKGKVSDEDHAAIGEKLKALKLADKAPAADGEEPPPNGAKPFEKKEEGVSKAAMDAAIAATAKATEAATIARLRGIASAEEAVKPYVGKLAAAFDSADGVYKAALETLGVSVQGIHPSAYRAILEAQPKPGATQPRARMASDQRMADSFAERFPDATRSI